MLLRVGGVALCFARAGRLLFTLCFVPYTSRLASAGRLGHPAVGRQLGVRRLYFISQKRAQVSTSDELLVTELVFAGVFQQLSSV